MEESTILRELSPRERRLLEIIYLLIDDTPDDDIRHKPITLDPEPEYVPNTVDSIKEFQDDWLREREEKERYIASLLNED